MEQTSLREKSARFADEIQTTIRGVLPGKINVQSIAAPGRGDRLVVRPSDGTGDSVRIPLYVSGEELAQFSIRIYLVMDRVNSYLKTPPMDLAVHSTLDRTPLARAHAVRPKIVKKPHDMSSLHFAVGGERFCPCLEDFLHFLVHECGVDAIDGWENRLTEGRERWRRRQLRTMTRDAQNEVAEVLVAEGWTVHPPAEEPGENTRVLTMW